MKSLLFITVFIISCGASTTTPSVPGTDQLIPITTDITFCATADANLQKLGCIPTAPAPFTANGKSFQVFCEETQTNGVFLNPKCLSTITSCSQINVCTGSQ